MSSGSRDDVGRKRVVIVAGSLVVTSLLAYVALLLGSWAFETRRFRLHEGRLARLLEQRPQADQVIRALEDEGSPRIASPRAAEELARVAGERGAPRSEEILRKGRRWPRTEVFQAGDMVYFLYFDAAGVLRDYTCVSR